MSREERITIIPGVPRVGPRGEERERKALALSLSCTLPASREQVDGLTVVVDSDVGLTGTVLGLQLQRAIATLGRDGERAPTDLDGLTWAAPAGA